MSLTDNNRNEQWSTKGGGVVEPINKNNSTLQNLLNEFKDMREQANHYHLEEGEFEEEEYDDGEEYKLSEEESASIEDFLNDDEIFEEEILEEEIFEEDIKDLESEYMKYLDDDDDLEYGEEYLFDENAIKKEPIDVEVNITEMSNYEEETDEPVSQNLASTTNSQLTTDEIDRRLDEFEKRLLDKIMQQFAVKNLSQQVNKESVDELDVKTVKGQLVINGYTFTGEVVMFTPLDSLNQATWEEVVRRKGHCTYHLTTSGNGGWFIKKSNAPNPYAYIEKKEEAEELAKFYAMREKAELKIHNAKGVIEKSLSFGREKLRG